VSAAPASTPVSAPAFLSAAVSEPTINLANLDLQLRHITERIEALRPSNELENSIKGIRSDLSEIAQLITGALPRRAVESLEIEVKALAERIEHSRQFGVDTTAIAGLERGLNEIRDALHTLKPAESLVGFDDAVKELSQKVDLIVAKEDPAALQQLETAIGALRGIVSHVASNETLTKVAEDVRALAAKVDTLAGSAASNQGLSALESRIETLTNALTASADAGQAVPRELEKLLTGLIEKLEWVQLTHTDHAALAHLEDRIATLVQRFDASEMRFGHLEAVERGITDLLVHIEDIRGIAGKGATSNVPVAFERDVAEIKQSEQRTQDSLEAVQGTVEQVVDRLAMIESGIRESASRPAPVLPAPMPPAPMPPAAQLTVTAPPLSPVAATPFSPPPTPAGFSSAAIFSQSAPSSSTSAFASAAARAPILPASESIDDAAGAKAAPQPAAAARDPIDPDLPPDHPLEPGSTGNRTRSYSAADRIAASEAAVSTAKAPVITDAGEKPNFIAAARRAAQAAAASPAKSEPKAKIKGVAGATTAKPRSRKLIMAGAAALIVVGFIQIATRFFESGPSAPQASPPAAETQQEKAPPPSAAVPQPEAQLPQFQPAPSPAPSAPPSIAPSAPPSAAPAPAPTQKSGAAKSAPLALTPDADVTGSLPHAAAQAPIGDKLPATIGGPTLRAAALNGDAAASYEVAMRFADGHGVPANNAEAALWLERAARQGLAPAEFRLGGLYEKGLGVKKDLAKARDLYLTAADKGNGKAMHNLAVLYAEGIDGSPDYTNAAHWFREAAGRGVTDSQFNLGILYARGIGVAQNFAESYKWFALAASQGDGDSSKKRDEVGAKLDQQSLTAAQLAVKTFTPQPQPEDAIAVKAPPGGWDVTQTNAAKPKPHPVAAAAPAPKAAEAKAN
jgi:localization factor PodJL